MNHTGMSWTWIGISNTYDLLIFVCSAISMPFDTMQIEWCQMIAAADPVVSKHYVSQNSFLSFVRSVGSVWCFGIVNCATRVSQCQNVDSIRNDSNFCPAQQPVASNVFVFFFLFLITNAQLCTTSHWIAFHAQFCQWQHHHRNHHIMSPSTANFSYIRCCLCSGGLLFEIYTMSSDV